MSNHYQTKCLSQAYFQRNEIPMFYLWKLLSIHFSKSSAFVQTLFPIYSEGIMKYIYKLSRIYKPYNRTLFSEKIKLSVKWQRLGIKLKFTEVRF